MCTVPMSLRDALRHPSLAAAEPVLWTGTDEIPVRWVHSSEVIELAHLLRGGELVLTAALVLAGATEAQQRRYVRELVARGVTAVAVETSEALPEPVLDEARRREFPLIQLRRTVPFVEIAENINGLLLNESVHRLRLADSLSDELSERLTSGADLRDLVDCLASRLRAAVSVRDCAGSLLAGTAVDPATPETREAPIAVRHVVSAVLAVGPGPETDPALLEAALDRAPQSLALALLRTRPSDVDSDATRSFFHAVEEPERAVAPLARLAAPTRLAGAHFCTAVVSSGHAGALEQAMRRRGRVVLSRLSREEALSIVALPDDRPEHARLTLLTDLRQAAGEHRAAVGLLARGVEQLPRVVAEARRCLELPRTAREPVIDAAECAVERLVSRLRDREALRDYVGEQLGALLDQEPATRDRLLSTLVAFFDSGGNKTATARHLHLQRQTLYQRLDRLSGLLERDLTAPSALPALHVAVRLWQALQSDAPNGPAAGESFSGSW